MKSGGQKMADIIEDLKQKRRTIEQFQKDAANQEGQRVQLFKQLEQESDVSTVVKAEEVVKRLCEERAENEKLLEELDKEMSEIICKAVPGSDSGTAE